MREYLCIPACVPVARKIAREGERAPIAGAMPHDRTSLEIYPNSRERERYGI